ISAWSFSRQKERLSPYLPLISLSSPLSSVLFPLLRWLIGLSIAEAIQGGFGLAREHGARLATGHLFKHLAGRGSADLLQRCKRANDSCRVQRHPSVRRLLQLMQQAFRSETSLARSVIHAIARVPLGIRRDLLENWFRGRADSLEPAQCRQKVFAVRF